MEDLIHIVLSDLEYLSKEGVLNIDDDSLRRTSPILRRLLIQNDLQKVWKELGLNKEPRFKVPMLSKVLKEIPKNKVIFASAGGAKYNGLELIGVLVVDYVFTSEERKRLFSKTIMKETLGLNAFVKSNSIIIEGREISRSTLIKYIANKLGGDHYDQRRVDNDVDDGFVLLDKVTTEEYKLADKNAVYFEFLSLIQTLINSRDIAKLIKKYK